MKPSKIVTAEAVATTVADGATLAVIGGGGGVVEPSALLAALETRFLETGHPRDLTVVHALGIGDRGERGMSRFAHEGMVRRVIGGHWVWSPRMQEMARAERIEAYVLPGGVIMQLLREIGAGRPGLITHVGLGTFADPRLEGGRMNRRATEALVEVIEIDGRELLRYKPFPVDVAVLRASATDAQGNLSFQEEPANLDAFAIALAAHNSGGTVLAQVRAEVPFGSLPARAVRVPGALVDAVAIDPGQLQSYDIVYDPTISGEQRGPVPPEPVEPFGVRQAIARRAADELRDGATINYGFGVPDAVAKLVAARGDAERYYQTTTRRATSTPPNSAGSPSGREVSSTSPRTRARSSSAAPSRPRAPRSRPATGVSRCAVTARSGSWSPRSPRSPSRAPRRSPRAKRSWPSPSARCFASRPRASS